jgi:hypothetical protein
MGSDFEKLFSYCQCLGDFGGALSGTTRRLKRRRRREGKRKTSKPLIYGLVRKYLEYFHFYSLIYFTHSISLLLNLFFW